MRIAVVGLIVGSIVLSVQASAEPPPAKGATAVPVTAGHTASGIDAALSTGATITGRLVDKLTGDPLSGIALIALGKRFGVGESGVYSGSDGTFAISGLPASSTGYVVCTQNEADEGETTAYATQCFPDAFYAQLSGVPAGATRVPLAAGQTKDIGDIALTLGGRIQGRVRTQSGSLLEHVAVTARSLSNSYLTFADNTGGTRSTTYFVDGLPPSPNGWQVCFDGRGATPKSARSIGRFYLDGCYRDIAWHGGPLPRHATPVRVGAGKTTVGIGGRLAGAGAISGVVSDRRSGKPLPYARISVFNSRGRVVRVVGTGRTGHYTAAGLHNGRFRVCADETNDRTTTGYVGGCWRAAAWSGGAVPSSARAVNVRRGGTTTGVRIGLDRGATISGTVGSSGAPQSGVHVLVFTSAGHPLFREPPATTDADGHYHLKGLRARKSGYLLCATNLNREIGSPSKSAAAPTCFGADSWDGAYAALPVGARRVHVSTRGHRTGVEMTMRAGGAITGTVTAMGSSAALTDYFIYAYDHAGRVVGQSGASTPSGAYSFRGLAPSSDGYTVCFSGNAYPDPSSGSDDAPYVGECYHNANWPH